ncbi:hypothetical protein M9X92_006696 [Pyricularia oryzae]|nr:hypothetical protein M9X92_006696 [Pyricularia oryzae]
MDKKKVDASGKVRNATINNCTALHWHRDLQVYQSFPNQVPYHDQHLAPSLPVLPVALPDGVHQQRISHLRGQPKIFASSIEQLLPQRFLNGSNCTQLHPLLTTTTDPHVPSPKNLATPGAIRQNAWKLVKFVSFGFVYSLIFSA